LRDARPTIGFPGNKRVTGLQRIEAETVSLCDARGAVAGILNANINLNIGQVDCGGSVRRNTRQRDCLGRNIRQRELLPLSVPAG
jgi:hypothetical protein